MPNILSKAISVASGGTVTDLLPAPLASDVIDQIREINVMRTLISTFKMNSRTFKKPRKTGQLAAYYIPDGTTATQSSFSTGSVEWVAKKLMAMTLVDEEAIEDSINDVVDMVLSDFAEAIAEAEELALTQGDVDHTATATSPEDATEANWYRRDPRLTFNGLFTFADGPEAAEVVDAGSNTISLDLVNKALFNMGKYGRNKRDLVGCVSSDQAANMRTLDAFNDASAAGAALAAAAQIAGLGGAGMGNNVVAPAYGVPMVEVPYAPSGTLVIFNKRSPKIGDRRMIKFKDKEEIESDQRKYVVSERIAFNCERPEPFAKIKNLSTTIVT